jgi:hypothetical protein
MPAPAVNPRELVATGPATLSQAMQEEELRAWRNAVHVGYPLDAVRVRIVPRGDSARERLVDENAVLAWMLKHVAPPACWHLQGLARGGTPSRPPGMVRSGGQTRVVRNHG